MAVKDDDTTRKASRREERAGLGPSPEDARSGVRSRHVPDGDAEIDVGPTYALQTPVGETAYGRAYRALHLAQGREVALHLLDIVDEREASGLPLAVAKCAQLQHKYVIGLETYGRAREPGTYYLVTQPLEGESLATQLADERTFELSRALSLTLQILRALRAAHKLGIVHGALSPANVRLVSGEHGEEARVVGFDCAAFQPASLAASEDARTPRAYEAPEGARGAAPDVHADVFSLGSLLFRMLSGEPPRVVQGEPPPSLEKASATAVPPALDELLARCLEPEPGARLVDTLVLTTALREIAEGVQGEQPFAQRRDDASLPPRAGGLLDEIDDDFDELNEDFDEPEDDAGGADDRDEGSGVESASARGWPWILGGLALALAAVWLLWEASTRLEPTVPSESAPREQTAP